MLDTIYMDKVLDYCSYFDKIVDDDRIIDELSFDLIDWYKDYVFDIDINNENNITLIKEIDKCMYMYIDDYSFQKKIRREVSIKDIDINSKKKTEKLVKKLLTLKEKYEKESILNIISNKWI